MSLSPRTKTVIVVLAVISVLLAGLEWYVRRTATYVVKNAARKLPAFAENDPEFLIRHTPQGKRLIPNAQVVIHNHWLSQRDIQMSINSLGFRDDELARPKPRDEFRILVLGDSITWGDYLQAEEVYVEHIEMALQGQLGEKRVEVINAGIGDIGLKEEIRILEERGLAVEPDLVLVSFYLNDSRPPWGFIGERGRPGWLRRHSVLAETLHRKMRLERWIKRGGKERFDWVLQQYKLNWKDDPDAFQQLASLARYDWGAAWEEDAWVVIDEQLNRLQALSRKHQFPVAIIIFPVSFQVYAGFLEDKPQRLIQEKSTSRGFQSFDLLPLLRVHQDDDLFYDMCHPRPETNRLIGEAIAGFLTEDLPL